MIKFWFHFWSIILLNLKLKLLTQEFTDIFKTLWSSKLFKNGPNLILEMNLIFSGAFLFELFKIFNLIDLNHILFCFSIFFLLESDFIILDCDFFYQVGYIFKLISLTTFSRSENKSQLRWINFRLLLIQFQYCCCSLQFWTPESSSFYYKDSKLIVQNYISLLSHFIKLNMSYNNDKYWLSSHASHKK